MSSSTTQIISIGGLDAAPDGPPKWKRSADGWDTGSQKWIIPALVVDQVETRFAQGDAHPDRQWMRVDGIDWEDNGTDSIASIQYRGLLAPNPSIRPLGRSLSGSAETTSGKNIATPDWSGLQPAEVEEPRTAYEVRYILVDEDPDMTELGKALTPPEAPTPASFFWSFLTDYIRLFPKGWVLADRSADQIPGAQVYLVRDSYKFQYEFKPGDI